VRYPSVSVALCTYNGARFLDEQLASLAAQTWRPLELVVCDDRSTDSTLAILAKFASTASFPVRIVQNGAWLGYKSNFKKAACLCQGELITFCDQDDIWLPTKLEVCCKKGVVQKVPFPGNTGNR
jgi:glycosyltransferase involved in cell wall biosynthesis